MTHYAAVYFSCVDETRDRVAPRVWKACQALYRLERTGISFDELEAMRLTRGDSAILFVPTREVISHDYARFAPLLAGLVDADFAGVVNWHEGCNAPDDIFCIHTTGDAPSGVFGPADPSRNRILIRAIESARRAAGLDSFRTMTEATHWSGIPYGGRPGQILDYPVPLVDIEIGSAPAAWDNPIACEVLARALVEAAMTRSEPVFSLLCVGGVHFELSYGSAMLLPDDDSAVGVSHILANQWVVAGRYDSADGIDKLRACVASIRGGIGAIIYHDNLKGAYKAVLRRLGEELGVAVTSHRAIRTVGDIRALGVPATYRRTP